MTGSEVSRHGRGELGRHELSEDLVEVLGLCEHYRLATDGAFDAWLPGRGFDPCAVVKGWSVERGPSCCGRPVCGGSASTPGETWSSRAGPGGQG